jgi:GDP-fucose protein O-fucosyltransferase
MVFPCFKQVAFQALRFSAPIMELGNKLAARMQSKGPYLALHLRMEMDVWVCTGCLPGISPESDKIIQEQRKLHPELLTGRSNMSTHERKLAGQCPLNALDVSRYNNLFNNL